jgi:hypothetical protein
MWNKLLLQVERLDLLFCFELGIVCPLSNIPQNTGDIVASGKQESPDELIRLPVNWRGEQEVFYFFKAKLGVCDC